MFISRLIDFNLSVQLYPAALLPAITFSSVLVLIRTLLSD